MKKRFRTAGICFVLLTFLCLGAGGVFAEEVSAPMPRANTQSFGFKISGTSGRCTLSATKMVSYAPYRIHFVASSAPNQIIINSVMHDASENVLGQGKVQQATVAHIDNSGSAGGWYHANLWREYSWDPGVEVNGFFSPDNF